MKTIYAHMNSTDHWESLPATLEVERAECALFEIQGKINPCPKSAVYFCADFADTSLIGNYVMPILRRLKLTKMKDESGSIRKTFTELLWVPIVRSPLEEIRLYITDAQGDDVPFEQCSLACTLVGREQVQKW